MFMLPSARNCIALVYRVALIFMPPTIMHEKRDMQKNEIRAYIGADNVSRAQQGPPKLATMGSKF